MQSKMNETLGQLHQAAQQLVIGFERAAQMNPAEQIEAMREASEALLEMRRVTEGLTATAS